MGPSPSSSNGHFVTCLLVMEPSPLNMTISWYGHSCFRIEAKEGPSTGSGQVSILIDPFSKDIGLRPPKIKDDIILVSHQHYDHNNTDDANPEAFIISTPGEFEKRGVMIKGILSYHDKTEGRERGINTIYVIKSEDINICHLGDFGQDQITNEQIEAIGDVDILMIPVGGNYTINAKEAVDVISHIEPKIIVPMHFKLPGLTVDIDEPEKFMKEIGLTPEKVDKFKVAKKTLPAEEMKLVMFNF